MHVNRYDTVYSAMTKKTYRVSIGSDTGQQQLHLYASIMASFVICIRVRWMFRTFQTPTRAGTHTHILLFSLWLLLGDYIFSAKVNSKFTSLPPISNIARAKLGFCLLFVTWERWCCHSYRTENSSNSCQHSAPARRRSNVLGLVSL